MQSVITIELSDELKRAVDELSGKEGISPNELVGRAVKHHIFLAQFRSLRERLTANAGTSGAMTDQEVFDRVS